MTYSVSGRAFTVVRGTLWVYSRALGWHAPGQRPTEAPTPTGPTLQRTAP